jgi:hypothetical protein
MLPCPDHHDEDAHDVLAGATLYWMRSFASLRMTVRCAPRSSDEGRLLPSPIKVKKTAIASRDVLRKGAVILRSAFGDEESHPHFRAGIDTTKDVPHPEDPG